jgi:glucose dehydrogenase
MRRIPVPIIALVCATAIYGQTDWPSYGHDPGGMRYSTLSQIQPGSVARLVRAWTYHTGDQGRQFESTPLVIGGVMYLSTQQQRIVALNAETGVEIWKYDPNVRNAREHRGVAYWPGAEGAPARIVFGTSDGRLIALDAKTGKPAVSFGDNGVVDLRVGVMEDFPKVALAITSPPAIYKNLVIVGPSTPEGPGRGPSGDPRAYDLRTGKLVWRFHLVPQPGEPGNETWGPDGWKDRSGPSLWSMITVDTEHGLVFLPTGNPADSFYGGDRKGSDLYANCVVALDASTGKLRWYYQVVHHDIFDYDVPAPPALIEVTRNGKKIPAVAQITKMGLLFILDRLTGVPIFGAEERPVPGSDVPGEEAWPTQPFPLKPQPLARTSMTRDEVSKRTPEAERYCTELFDKLAGAKLYTPYGTKTTLVFPGAMGGGNWGGVSFDPKLSYVFVNTSNMGAIGHLVPSAPGAPVAYRNESGYARFLDADHYPCQRPPWGELTAVNANTGEIAWKVPLGSFAELESEGFRNAGTPNVGGTIVTAGGLVFVAATNDAMLRAFDSRTGAELWSAKLDASGNSTPVTYQGRNGKQFVAVVAGGPAHLRNVGDTSSDSADSLIAFALSDRPVITERKATESKPATQPKPTPVTTANTTATDLPDATGKDIVVRLCTNCHGIATFVSNRMSADEWKNVVADMMARGASGSAADVRTATDYLVRNLGKPTR